MYKGKGVRFGLLFHFCNISHDNEIIGLTENTKLPNYFIFMGHFKTGGGEWASSEPPEFPLDPPVENDTFVEEGSS